MIAGFRDAGTEDVYHGRDSDAARAACPQGLLKRARRRLDQLHAAARLADLAVPPGNRLQPQTGGRAGQHSVRLDPGHALCFAWTERGPRNVELADVRQPPSGPSATRTTPSGLSPAQRAPTHPGEMLREELLKPLKITQGDLSRLVGIPADAAGLLLNRHGDLTAELASALERAFAISAELWLSLQAQWDAHQRRQISWGAAAAAGSRDARAATGARGKAPAQVIELPLSRLRRARGPGDRTAMPREQAKRSARRSPRAGPRRKADDKPARRGR